MWPLALALGILIGIAIGFMTSQFLIPRFPGFSEKLFTRMDAGARKLELSYYRIFNLATRSMRDRGWFNSKFAYFLITVPNLIQAGINKGAVLEIGSGPGYLGLEWLKHTDDSSLVGLDHSREMVEIARINATEYNKKPEYIAGDAQFMRFPDKTFDGLFSSASLHEWDDPLLVFKEIRRVLKPGATFYITDLRRDTSLLSKFTVWLSAWPSAIRKYFLTSFNHSYTIEEVSAMLHVAGLTKAKITKSWFSFIVIGKND